MIAKAVVTGNMVKAPSRDRELQGTWSRKPNPHCQPEQVPEDAGAVQDQELTSNWARLVPNQEYTRD